jgi:glycosyltransferase involved in cell wall biosynthesis
LHVLIVTQYFWPEEFRVNDLALDLSRRGHQVTVLTGQPSYPNRAAFNNQRRPWTDTVDGIEVVRIPLASRGNGEAWRLALNYLSFATSASLLAPFRLRRRPDVIFVFQMSPVTMALPAVLLKKLRGIPLVSWVQDLWPETLVATGAVTWRPAIAVLDQFVRWTYRACDHVFVQSRAFLPVVRRTGVPTQRLSYLPNWAEPSYGPVTVEPDAEERRLVPPGFVVMLAGNLGTAQALPTVIDAAERLRGRGDICLVLVGDGQLRPWVEREVQERGLASTVHLLGRHPVEAMPRFFALADVLLVTLSREPVFALTVPSRLQSYLACGKPVVGALDGAGAQVVEDSGAGIAVPAEDAHALAAAILEMYEFPSQQRAEMGQRGREYFLRHFERSALLDELEERLSSLSRR